jgi:hypothetical protein
LDVAPCIIRMEVVSTCETSASFYQTTLINISDESDIQVSYHFQCINFVQNQCQTANVRPMNITDNIY